jgi:hypothetical protein
LDKKLILYDTSTDIGNEHAMELSLLEELCQLYPMLDGVELRRSIIRMSPKAG